MAEVVHTDIPISRAQRRRIEQLADAVDRTTRGDARFFERFPDRRYRLRLSSQAELEQNRMMGCSMTTVPGRRWFTVVKQIAPGARCRLFVLNKTDSETDMPDEEAGKVYEFLSRLNGKRVSDVEDEVRAIVERKERS